MSLRYHILLLAGVVAVALPMIASAETALDIPPELVGDSSEPIQIDISREPAQASPAVAAKQGPAQWGYVGKEAATHWGELDVDYHTCRDGVEQSPINMKEYVATDLPALQPAYHKGSLEVINNGHTVEVNAAGNGKLVVGDSVYELLQFHFHTPSEHYIDGAPYPMEVHFVHQAKDGTLAVLGVMLEVGAYNDAIDTLWQAMPTQQGTGESVLLSAADLLPPSLEYYRYNGSLTTPPCSENVQWHVAKETITLSEEQLRAFQALFPLNARPIQPINERQVKG